MPFSWHQASRASSIARFSNSLQVPLPTGKFLSNIIAVFELRDGTFPLRDSDGNTINAKRRLVAQLTIKDGRVWYERSEE